MKYNELDIKEMRDTLEKMKTNNIDLSELIHMTQHSGWEIFCTVLKNRIADNTKKINEVDLLRFEESKEKIKNMLKENKDFEYVLHIAKEAQQIIDSNNSVIEKISSKLQSILQKK